MKIQLNFTKRFLPLLDVSLILVGIFIIALTVGKFGEDSQGLKNVYAFKLEESGKLYWLGNIKGNISYFFHTSKTKNVNFDLENFRNIVEEKINNSRVKKRDIIIALIYPKKSKEISFSKIEEFRSWVLLSGFNFMYIGN